MCGARGFGLVSMTVNKGWGALSSFFGLPVATVDKQGLLSSGCRGVKGRSTRLRRMGPVLESWQVAMLWRSKHSKKHKCMNPHLSDWNVSVSL